ncbi:MAG: hypothetical protein NVS3B17_03470 [Vulcanimicrobiaceae bacterium]
MNSIRSPHPEPGVAPAPGSHAHAPGTSRRFPVARSLPSPQGARFDHDTIAHASRDSRNAASRVQRSASAGWDAVVGNDLKAVRDPKEPWYRRLFHAALVGANVAGPEAFGLKAVGKGTFVLAEHVAGALTGRTAVSVGRLVMHDGARLRPDEMRIAAKLVSEGKVVETVPISRVRNQRTADFRIDGVLTELKTVKKMTSANMSTSVKRVLESAMGQARSIIVDTSGQPNFTREQAEVVLQRISGTSYRERYDTVRFIGRNFDFSPVKGI